MNRGMLKPILWTVVCVLAIFLVFIAQNNDTIWAFVMVAVAAVCAALQWMVYFKNK